MVEADTKVDETHSPSSHDGEAHDKTGDASQEKTPTPVEDKTEYPGTVAANLLMVAICVATFLVSLDRTVVATAIPRLTDEFHSFGDIGWYAGAYALSGCAMQLPIGRFYSFYSPKMVYSVLLFIFIIGSAIGAGAPSSTAVIVGRAVQGVGCAGVFSGSIILLMGSLPLQKRPMYVGAVMAVMSISSIIGPLIGGALTDGPGWRWCFIINIPLGIATIAIVYLTVKHIPGKEETSKSSVEKLKHLDPVGAAVLVPSVICLVLALQWGGAEYAWSSWRIILLLVFACVLGIAFVVVQAKMPDTATVAPKVIRQRSVLACLLYSTCNGGAMMVVVYWIPIWFQAIKAASPVKSGEMTIPLLLSQSLSSIIAGVLVSKVVGYAPPFMIAASVIMSIGTGLLTTLKITSGHAEWIGYQVIFGFGLGFGMQQSSNAVQAILSKEDFNSAISLFFFGMQLGGSVCVCIGQNVLNQKLIGSLKDARIPGLDPYAVLHTGATQLGRLVSSEADLQKLQLAYNKSLTSVFYVAVAVAALSIFGGLFVEWKSIKGSDHSPFDE
ncbi:major facilitator superfamily transporter [Purpureocillium lavendulum]|uniref:Major facilitator superfamily transporter n=1 Tax=Purpureocillium lavendulum TaxID=1247861 RepID=A0AB34G2B7_9HYPO|nr:major facilitator superfamily transporter [Purpureocillium lavendulum]